MIMNLNNISKKFMRKSSCYLNDIHIKHFIETLLNAKKNLKLARRKLFREKSLHNFITHCLIDLSNRRRNPPMNASR